MKNQRVLGLVATGRLDPALANQKHLGRVLGPIKSSSVRVASRISNSIRAGEAARDYEAFAQSEVILIAVERPEFACVVHEMAESSVDWSGKTIAVMDTFHESSDLEVLSKLGALTASIEAVGGFDGDLWIAEGHTKACSALRRLLGGIGSKVKEIRHGKKHSYTAGMELAGNCLVPLLLSSMEFLKRSGLDTTVAWSVCEKTAANAIRGYRKAGRKAWGGGASGFDAELVERRIGALAEGADRYLAAAALAAELMGKDAKVRGGAARAKVESSHR